MSSVGRHVKYSDEISAIGKKYTEEITFTLLNLPENNLNEKLVKLTRDRLDSSRTG
jgi:hypothetical protein